MQTDLAHWRRLTGPRVIGSIHFGGGTPSLLTGAQIAELIGTTRALWTLGDCEIALEANPNDVTVARIEAWAQAGLTRLSLGVQSFDDPVLALLGRDHDGVGAERAVKSAVQAFSSVSADLIFGVSGEADTRLSRDLDRLLDLGVPHISTYQLTIEPGTAFARAEARGASKAVADDDSARQFEQISDRLTSEGFVHYEVSNFARPGFESQHNLAYWQARDYVGVGPGAHGRLWTDKGRQATETALRPGDYIASVSETGTGITDVDLLSSEAASEEYVLMGLRIKEGLSLTRLATIRGEPLKIDPDLIQAGWLEIEGDQLRATAAGRMVLDALTRTLLLS